MTDLWKTVANRWQDSVNLFLGVWLFVSPWVLQFTATELAMWNAFVIGVIIVVAAIAALVAFHEWEEWADIAFGIWLIVAPWVLGFGTATAGSATGAFAATWNFVIVGVLTTGLAAWSLWNERQRGSHAT